MSLMIMGQCLDVTAISEGKVLQHRFERRPDAKL